MRKYRDIQLTNSCYVTSSYDYHFHVTFAEYRDGEFVKRHHGSYTWGLAAPLGFEAPAYLEEEIRRQLLDSLKASRMTFYEHDQDSNERQNNLRYHDDRIVAEMIEGLSDEQ